jgi:hypothetical protein
MRYHWGLAIGHFHAHQSTPVSGSLSEEMDMDTLDAETEQLPGGGNAYVMDMGGNARDEFDNPEMLLDDRDLEGWEDVESGASDDDCENSELDSEEDDGGMYE